MCSYTFALHGQMAAGLKKTWAVIKAPLLLCSCRGSIWSLDRQTQKYLAAAAAVVVAAAAAAAGWLAGLLVCLLSLPCTRS